MSTQHLDQNGHSAHICSGCGTPHPADHPADEPFVVPLDDDLLLLRYLADLADDRKRIDEDERRAVEALRQLDVSWAKIAFRLGVDRKTLQRSYSYLG